MIYRARIQHIAAMDGIASIDRDKLLAIAERSIAGCSLDDAVRVAYVVYRMLRPTRH